MAPAIKTGASEPNLNEFFSWQASQTWTALLLL
jgi:hypothetical protein